MPSSAAADDGPLLASSVPRSLEVAIPSRSFAHHPVQHATPHETVTDRPTRASSREQGHRAGSRAGSPKNETDGEALGPCLARSVRVHPKDREPEDSAREGSAQEGPPPGRERCEQPGAPRRGAFWDKAVPAGLRRGWAIFSSRMEPAVFIPSALLVVGFVLMGSLASEVTAAYFTTVRDVILGRLGWFYVLGASLILVFVLGLLVGPSATVRLGPDDEKPEFSRAAWLAMLFSAGMGTGLVYWGVAEPVHHLLDPPPGLDGPVTSRTHEATRALSVAFFHWGLHPWAIYALFGVSIAYFHFRRGLPLAPRAMLYPVLGRAIFRWPGHLVDIVCTVGTLFGVATSLGLGAQQVNAGLALAAGIASSDVGVQLLLIAVMTAVATLSVVMGIKGGIRRLSQINMILAGLMLLFVAALGPTVEVLRLLTSSLGAYLSDLPGRALYIRLEAGDGWQERWTLFYWSWWISWAPFVGVFIARISRGRTIREFVASVLLVPSGVTFVWLSVVGGTGMSLVSEAGGGGAMLAEAARSEPAIALHRLLAELPLGFVTLPFATLLIVLFFISSSDSGSLVDDMVTSGGHPNPPRVQRVFWAVSEGAVAATLLSTGGLEALRTASLQSGLPMLCVLLLAAFGLARALGAYEAA